MSAARFAAAFGARRISSLLAALVLGACASQPGAPDTALEELFTAERGFARDATERGIRAAFLEHFADDGIDFRPGPGVMRERLLARPAPADPLALILDWSPQAGTVARAADLGYTTGPYSLADARDAHAPTRPRATATTSRCGSATTAGVG